MSSAWKGLDEVDNTPREPISHIKPGLEGNDMMKDQNRCESTADSGLGSLGSFGSISSNPSLTTTHSVTADLARLELAETIYRENESKCVPIPEEEGYGSMSMDPTTTAEPVAESWEEDRDTIESLFIQDTDGDT